MSSIVITGTRTERYLKDVPVTTQVIKGAKLRESGPMDVSQILGELTGVSVVENQFGSGIELSGFGADHILVLIDGMEMLGRTNGQFDISQISPDQIERIEVVRGASSALYGSDAMGGIINILTKKPKREFGFSVNGDIGSHGRFSGNLTLTGGLGDWKSKVYFNARGYDGNDVNSNSLWENGSKYNKYDTGLRLEHPKLIGGIVRLDTKIFKEKQSLNNDNVFEDSTENLKFTSRLEYEGNRDKIKYKTGLEYSFFDHLYKQIVVSSGHKRSNDSTIDGLFKADMTFETKGTIHQINGGVGYDGETIESDRIENKKERSDLLHIFAQDEWQLFPKTTLLTGFRLDNHSLYGNYISPKISIMYKPEPISRVRLSYGRGFKAPTFKEMFLDYTVQLIGYHIIGNPDLEPEISNSIIIDVERWHTKKYHARINVFYNEIQNLIDYSYKGVDEFNRSEWQSANIVKAITKGFDVDFTYFIIPEVEFSIGYSFLDTWDVDNESPINLKAKHKGNSKLRIKLPFDIYFNLRSQFVGQRYFGEFGLLDDEITEEWIDQYVLLHTNINIPIINKFELNAGVNNITHQYDKDWGPMPGREWYVGIRYNNNK